MSYSHQHSDILEVPFLYVYLTNLASSHTISNSSYMPNSHRHCLFNYHVNDKNHEVTHCEASSTTHSHLSSIEIFFLQTLICVFTLRQDFLWPSPPPRVTSGIVSKPPGPSQCPYTKSLFQNNSYESVYGLTLFQFCLSLICSVNTEADTYEPSRIAPSSRVFNFFFYFNFPWFPLTLL